MHTGDATPPVDTMLSALKSSVLVTLGTVCNVLFDPYPWYMLCEPEDVAFIEYLIESELVEG